MPKIPWRNALEAGWRVVVFDVLALAIVIACSIVVSLPMLLRAGINRLAVQHTISALNDRFSLTFTAIELIGVLSATLIMNRRDHFTLADIGFPWRRLFSSTFWIGAGSGFLAIACVVGSMAVFGSARVQGPTGFGLPLLGNALLWALSFLLVGTAEELANRGYPQFVLAKYVGYWPGAVVTSLLFAVGHVGNPGETPLGLVEIVPIGLLFCLALRRLGDLRWPIGFHAGWDWGQTGFFGTSDSGVTASSSILHTETSGPGIFSGGSAGPEATIFALVAIGVVAIVFQACASRRAVTSMMT